MAEGALRRYFAPMHWRSIGLALILMGHAMSAHARDWSADGGRTQAYLFAYDVDRGRQAEFVAGYQEHLRWHVDHRDHLAWYGWFVANGPRAGAFIDGAFGVTLEEWDRRPALADDARHF